MARSTHSQKVSCKATILRMRALNSGKKGAWLPSCPDHTKIYKNPYHEIFVRTHYQASSRHTLTRPALACQIIVTIQNSYIFSFCLHILWCSDKIVLLFVSFIVIVHPFTELLQLSLSITLENTNVNECTNKNGKYAWHFIIFMILCKRKVNFTF